MSMVEQVAVRETDNSSRSCIYNDLNLKSIFLVHHINIRWNCSASQLVDLLHAKFYIKVDYILNSEVEDNSLRPALVRAQ